MKLKEKWRWISFVLVFGLGVTVGAVLDLDQRFANVQAPEPNSASLIDKAQAARLVLGEQIPRIRHVHSRFGSIYRSVDGSHTYEIRLYNHGMRSLLITCEDNAIRNAFVIDAGGGPSGWVLQDHKNLDKISETDGFR